MTEFMTVRTLADYLSVNKRTIYRLLVRGDIPAVKIGRDWRFDKNSIDEWLHRNAIGISAHILVIDDDRIIGLLFKKTLEELGHRVTTVDNSYEVFELVNRQDFDIVFLDLKIPGIDGAELLHQIRILKPELKVVIITGYPDSEIMSKALAYGPLTVMNKPFSESDIITVVRNFLPITKQ